MAVLWAQNMECNSIVQYMLGTNEYVYMICIDYTIFFNFIGTYMLEIYNSFPCL